MNREELKAKSRAHFAWQEHTASRTDFKPAGKLILLRLALHKNIETDRCDPSSGTLAKETNVNERTVTRTIAQAERLGLIAVTRTAGGRHKNTHSFRFILPEGVVQEPPQRVVRKARTGGLRDVGRVVPRPDKYEDNIARGATAPGPAQEGERDALARDDSHSGLEGRLEAPSALEDQEASKQGVADEGSKQTVVVLDRFAELWAIWNRGWPGDQQPDRQAASRQAYARARLEAAPQVIIDAAKAWAAAADAPRYLSTLATWLDDRSWTKQPPQKRAKATWRGNGRPRVANPIRVMEILRGRQ